MVEIENAEKRYGFVMINWCINCADLREHSGVFVDLDDLSIKSARIAWVNEALERMTRKYPNKRKAISKTYDLYIEKLERKLNKTIEIVHLTVRAPSHVESSIDELLLAGVAGCYIVRRNMQCIQVLSCTNI